MAYQKLNLEGVEILPGSWRNFSGVKTKYNAEGSRNFKIKLTPEQAEMCREVGLSVKVRAPRDEDDEALEHTKILVSYNGKRPPAIWMYTDNGNKVRITQDTVGELDNMRIIECDISLTCKDYDSFGGGTCAYLDTMRFRAESEPFADKWDGSADVQDPDIPF